MQERLCYAAIVQAAISFVALSIVVVGLGACSGGEAESDTVPLGTFKVIATSEIPTGVRDFDGQNLLAAREESTGVLKAAYDGAIAGYTERHGRSPQDDLEIAAAICDWVALNLRHPYFYPEDPSLPRTYRPNFDPTYNNFYWDPVEIIRYTLSFDTNDAENWPSPFCTHQNFAAAGIMNFAGLHARVCTVENHDGLEYFSWKYQKWIWCDSTFNEHFLFPHMDGTLEPLGAKELQELTLFGGLERVVTVKHGHPDGTYPQYNYLDVSPHGFRRYAPIFYMNTLNGEGRSLRRVDVISSCLPVPATYVATDNEVVELELDSSSVFSLLPRVQDPRLLDVPIDALTFGDVVSPQKNALMFNLRTWLPHACRFESRHGDGALWQTIEMLSDPISTARTSCKLVLPWTAGVVSFRAVDCVGNTSKTFTLLLSRNGSN